MVIVFVFVFVYFVPLRQAGRGAKRRRGWINHPLHTNTNPQTLAITGVPADWVITKVVER